MLKLGPEETQVRKSRGFKHLFLNLTFILFVHQHVRFELVGVGKVTLTKLALKWFL